MPNQRVAGVSLAEHYTERRPTLQTPCDLFASALAKHRFERETDPALV
jgi:hypothetical protein